MPSQKDTVSKGLKSSHVILPVAIGLLTICWMFHSEFSTLADEKTNIAQYFNLYTCLFIFLAFLMACFKDFCGMCRLRLLSDRKLGFGSLFRIRMLYEFTSAATPSVAGGSVLEMVFINKEGLKFGESTAITLTSLFLDELFYVLALPLILIIIPFGELFAISGDTSATIISLFMIGYAMKLFSVSVMSVGIFIKPDFIAWVCKYVCRIKFLRKYKMRAYRTAIDMRVCSRQMQHKSGWFWAAAVGITFVMWIAKFLVLNLLIMSFVPLDNQIMVVARQVVMNVVMLIAPTPGGSGFIELMFSNYLSEFVPGGIILMLIVVFWRLFTYYDYLLAGVIIAPRWISKNFSKKKKN